MQHDAYEQICTWPQFNAPRALFCCMCNHLPYPRNGSSTTNSYLTRTSDYNSSHKLWQSQVCLSFKQYIVNSYVV